MIMAILLLILFYAIFKLGLPWLYTTLLRAKYGGVVSFERGNGYSIRGLRIEYDEGPFLWILVSRSKWNLSLKSMLSLDLVGVSFRLRSYQNPTLGTAEKIKLGWHFIDANKVSFSYDFGILTSDTLSLSNREVSATKVSFTLDLDAVSSLREDSITMGDVTVTIQLQPRLQFCIRAPMINCNLSSHSLFSTFYLFRNWCSSFINVGDLNYRDVRVIVSVQQLSWELLDQSATPFAGALLSQLQFHFTQTEGGRGDVSFTIGHVSVHKSGEMGYILDQEDEDPDGHTFIHTSFLPPNGDNYMIQLVEVTLVPYKLHLSASMEDKLRRYFSSPQQQQNDFWTNIWRKITLKSKPPGYSSIVEIQNFTINPVVIHTDVRWYPKISVNVDRLVVQNFVGTSSMLVQHVMKHFQQCFTRSAFKLKAWSTRK